MLNHEQHAILKDVQRTGGFIIPTEKKGKFKGADGELIKGLTADMLEGFKDNGLVTEPAEGTADAGTFILSREVPEVLSRADLVSAGGDTHDDATAKKKAIAEANDAAKAALDEYEDAQAKADEALKDAGNDPAKKTAANELQKVADKLKTKAEAAKKAAEKAAA